MPHDIVQIDYLTSDEGPTLVAAQLTAPGRCFTSEKFKVLLFAPWDQYYLKLNQLYALQIRSTI